MLGPCHGVKGRKPQTQALLPAWSTDANAFGNPTTGRSFFPAAAVSAHTSDIRSLSWSRSRPVPLPRLAICASARCHSRLFTSGVGTARPPTRPQVLRLAHCHSGAVPILPFPPPFLAGTAGRRYLLRPGGTALLCFPATRDPPVSGPSQKDWPSLALAAERIFFGSTRKSGSRPGEQAPPASRCPARKQGGKGEKSVCIKTAFPSSASSATTHS